MWWIDFFKTGFSEQGSLSSLILFRLIFSVCCILKFIVETKRGYFNYFDEDSYLYGFYQIKPHFFHLSTFFYKLVYISKIIACIFVLLGFFIVFSLSILLLSMIVELQIYFKFHVNFFVLALIFLLLFSFEQGDSLGLWDAWQLGPSAYAHRVAGQQGDLFPQLLIMATVTVMYLATAYRKWNPVFLSGAVVYTHLQQKLEEFDNRKYFDGIYPCFVTKLLVYQGEKTLASRWKPMMLITILLEILIPISLWFESTQVVGMILGIFMHTVFTFIAPGTLAHFSLVTIGTYILFMNPQIISSWLMSL